MTTTISSLGERTQWRVSGPAGMKFLDDVLSADLDGLEAGQGAMGALLTDKGRIRTIVRVLATGGGAALVDCDPGGVLGVEAGLVRIAPLGGVDLTPEPRVLLRLVGDVPADLDPGPGEYDHAERHGAVLVRTHWGGAGIDVLAEPERESEWTERLQSFATGVEPDALEEARIRGARPVYGVDVDDTTHVLETPLPDRGAVAFDKGCYPGQESVARIRNLGRVRRRLVVLETAGAKPGAAVLDAAGAEAGRVTSAHGGYALAIVGVEAAAGALTVDGAPATVAPPAT